MNETFRHLNSLTQNISVIWINFSIAQFPKKSCFIGLYIPISTQYLYRNISLKFQTIPITLISEQLYELTIICSYRLGEIEICVKNY